MLQESKYIQKRCDGCSKVLTDRDAFVYTTDFKPTYIEKGDLHICPACSFEIMHQHIVGDIPVDELKKMLKHTHPAPFHVDPSRVYLPGLAPMDTSPLNGPPFVVTCSGTDDMSTGAVSL